RACSSRPRYHDRANPEHVEPVQGITLHPSPELASSCFEDIACTSRQNATLGGIFMSCLSEEATKILGDNGEQDLCHKLEEFHAAVLKQRVDFIEYGNPEELSDKRRAKLNCDLLRQVLIHRADKLIIATGQMLPAKNLYGMALAARGYI